MEKIKPALGEIGPTFYPKGPTSYSNGPKGDVTEVCFLDYIDNKMENENKYIVKSEDLIGDIKAFPIEVVQKMVDYQIEQGNIPNVTVFQKDCATAKFQNGFDWDETEEGANFWGEVIDFNNFEEFFKKYPKKYRGDDPGPKGKPGIDGSNKNNRYGLTGPADPNDYGCAGVEFSPKTGDYVLVSQDGRDIDWYKRIFLFKHNNIYYCLSKEDEDRFNASGVKFNLSASGWKFCKPIEIKLSINKPNSNLETYYINKQQFKMIEKIINNKD